MLALVGCAGGGAPISDASSSPGASGEPPSSVDDKNCRDTSAEALALRSAREQICALVNAERAKAGVGPVVLEVKRSAVAQAFAVDMTVNGYFSHTSPNGDGPAERLAKGGVTSTTWGENIALNPNGSPADVMNQWMDSSGHRANILDADYGRLGVGHDGSNWVQDFTN